MSNRSSRNRPPWSRPPITIPTRCTGRWEVRAPSPTFKADKATIWSPTQAVWPQRASLAMLLGLKPDDVRVIFRARLGLLRNQRRRYGQLRCGALSQAVGKPVRVQLSRKDEMAWENYGFAFVMDERAGLDAQGNIIAWDHEAWSPVLGNRPGYSTAGKRDHRHAGRV